MSSRFVVRAVTAPLACRLALRRTVPSYPQIHHSYPPAFSYSFSKYRPLSTMSHDHLKASKLFSCQGLTAVVTGRPPSPPVLWYSADMTGGGTGIGLMQTIALIENGAKVFIVSRDEEKLKDVAKKYGGDGQARGEIIPYVKHPARPGHSG